MMPASCRPLPRPPARPASRTKSAVSKPKALQMRGLLALGGVLGSGPPVHEHHLQRGEEQR